MSKILDIIFNTRNNFSFDNLENFTKNVSKFYQREYSKKSNSNAIRNRILIIIPGYSVSSPPKIGHHLHYITALQYHPINNPFGYKQIYLFDIYSKKDGRCNFIHSIPELANELFKSINTSRDNWEFKEKAEIDFLGASMGGLIVRKFIQKFLVANKYISTDKWGNIPIKNILLIATPNFGCKIVDKLQNPFLQFLIRLKYGKNNFASSRQFTQIRKGNIPLFNRLLQYFFKKRTEENSFLKELNSKELTPGTFRWLTVAGTKKQWFSRLLYNKKISNDGVVETKDVALPGAENIIDYEFNKENLWNHRDLYLAEDFCQFLFGLLSLELTSFEFRNLINNYELINYKNELIRKTTTDEHSKYLRKEKRTTSYS